MISQLTILDMGRWGGGGMMAPKNVSDHCAKTLRMTKLKHCDF